MQEFNQNKKNNNKDFSKYIHDLIKEDLNKNDVT
jgi:hypothetical protein